MNTIALPVIMYHAIDSIERYSMNEEIFIRQMDFLHNAGFATIVPDKMNEFTVSSRDIMISFDDGYATDFSVAFPVMSHYGFRAVSFVTTGFLGTRRGYLTWPQVRELKKAGFSIQSHTHTHPLLNLLTDNGVREELRRSKRVIEDKLGCAVTALSIPGGGFSPRVRLLAMEEGYDSIFTSVPGMNGSEAFEKRLFNRMLINGTTSCNAFSKIVQGDRRTYRRALRSYRTKLFIKKCVGFGTYQSLWRRYYKYRS